MGVEHDTLFPWFRLPSFSASESRKVDPADFTELLARKNFC